MGLQRPDRGGGRRSCSAWWPGVHREGASCVCPPGQRVSCYSGPPGTADVGECASGTALCDAQGTSLGPCEGEALPQPESCATPVDDDCDGEVNEGGSDCVSGITAQWAKQLSGISISAVAVDAFDNTVIAGSFRSPVDLGTGPLAPRDIGAEAFVAKFDPSGEALFAITFEGDDSAARDIATDASGNIALLGRFSKPVAVHLGVVVYEDYHRIVKLDPSGGFLWKADFKEEVRDSRGAEYQEFNNAVAMNAAGDVFVVGASREPVMGSGDGFVRKLDGATGALAWQKTVGDRRLDEVRLDGLGNVVLAGSFTSTLGLGGSGLTSSGGADMYLARLDPDGNVVFSESYGDAGDQNLMHLAVSADGAAVIAGTFAGSITLGESTLVAATAEDAFLAKVGF